MANTKTTALTELVSGSQADTDVIPIVDVSDTTQAASGSLKKFSWGSIKAALKTYFDGLYNPTGPAVSAYRATSNQSITSSAETKVQLNGETFDTASAFDSITNYRFTPQISGYYQVSFSVSVGATTGITGFFSSIRKNGTDYAHGTSTAPASSTSGTSVGSCLVYMNGSTDYLELFIYSNGTSPYVSFGATNTYFTAVLIRGT